MSSLMKFFKGHMLEYRCSAKNRIRLLCLKFRCLLFASCKRDLLIALFVNGFFGGNFDPLNFVRVVATDNYNYRRKIGEKSNRD